MFNSNLAARGKSILGHPLLWTALAAIALYPLGVRNHTLWGNHEPYVGGIVREMATSGNWVVPTLNGAPYLEKPPLFYALGALGCRLLGTFAPWALRLPSALMAMGTMLGACWLGRRLGSVRAGAWAGFLAGTNAFFLELGHTAVVDMTLTAAVTLALGLAWLAIAEPERRPGWVRGFWASLGLVFLAKGLIGPVLVLLPLLIGLRLWRGQGLGTAFLRPNGGMAIFAGLVGLWVIPLAAAGGREFLVEVFLRNTVGRFLASPALVPRTGRLGEHVETWTYYFRNTPGYLLPWVAIWGASLAAALRGRRKGPSAAFVPLAFAVDLLLLCLSKGKRMVYLLPVLPLTFVQAALWLDAQLPPEGQRAPAVAKGAIWASVALVGGLGAAVPWVVGVRFGPDLALSAGSLPLSLWALHTLRQNRLARGLGLAMGQWTVFLVLFMAVAAPQLDRRWRPLQVPYRLARDLEAQGCAVVACNLSETQLGYASLIFGHVLPCADTPEAVAVAMTSGHPVALLMESKGLWQQEVRSMGLAGVEVPTEASRSPDLEDRAPVLILNLPAAHVRGYSDS